VFGIENNAKFIEFEKKIQDTKYFSIFTWLEHFCLKQKKILINYDKYMRSLGSGADEYVVVLYFLNSQKNSN